MFFGGRTVYTDKYQQLGRYPRFRKELVSAAREQGMTNREWLVSRGFVWKETGYVEPDFAHSQDMEPPAELDAFRIADYAFRVYPLAGELVLTPEQSSCVFDSAQGVFDQITAGREPAPRQRVVLTFAVVQICKTYRPGVRDGSGDIPSFWDSIFRQFGFRAGNSDSLRGKLRSSFGNAVNYTLEAYRRFQAPRRGYLRYYTTLMLHAIAPEDSIFELFNILFDFYVKNLDFQYMPEDISYRQFVRGMRARYDSDVESRSGLTLKSGTVFSGLQALFKERPGYMAVLCDGLVCRMDYLLRGEGSDVLDPEHREWDRKLVQWYQQKTSADRLRMSEARRSHRPEFVATSSERITVQYALKNRLAGLQFPQIRLEGEITERPLLTVFQAGREIWSGEMTIRGDDLCQTTCSLFLPLQDTDLNFSEPFDISLRITCGGEDLYASGEKLRRQWILFDSQGRERRPAKGDAFLLLPEQARAVFPEDSDVYREPHPGQLLNFSLDSTDSASVDGVEIFAVRETAASFRRYTSEKPLPGLLAEGQGKQAQVFAKPFVLAVRIPQGEKILRYHLLLDGVTVSPSVWRDGDSAVKLDTNGMQTGVVHTAAVADLVDSRVRFTFSWVTLPGLAMTFDQPFYLEGADTPSFTLSYAGDTVTGPVILDEGEDSFAVDVPGTQLQLRADAPAVRCTFRDACAFAAPEKIWHRDIKPDETVKVSLPAGFQCSLYLGGKPVKPGQDRTVFELGVMVKSRPAQNPPEAVELEVSDGAGGTRRERITTVVYAPEFAGPPLAVSGGILKWSAEKNFIGDPGTRFEVETGEDSPGSFRFTAGVEDRDVMDVGSLPPGQYTCNIYARRRSLFSRGERQLLATETVPVGDPEILRFENRILHLEKAVCWIPEQDTLKGIPLPAGADVVEDLRYVETSIPDEETEPMPMYTGTLCHVTWNGNRVPFSSRETRNQEAVNPVSVWIAGEHQLILLNAEGEGVIVDQAAGQILEEKTDHLAIPRKEQYRRLRQPDYFTFSTEEVRNGV